MTHKSKSPLTKKKLQELYVRKKMSATQIAEALGVSHAGVYLALKRLGIPRRGRAEAARNRGVDSLPWKKIAKEYRAGSNCSELGEKYNCANTTVISRLREAGVEIRLKGHANLGKTWNVVEFDVEKAIKMNQEGAALPEIANKLGITYQTLWYRLKKMGYRPTRHKAKASKYKNLQYHKRKVAAELEMSCVICGEDRTVDLAHIASAKDGHSLSEENTIVLCPTHHRLFDSGKLSAKEHKKIRPILQRAAGAGFVNSFWGAL